jgi:hypothetical protein
MAGEDTRKTAKPAPEKSARPRNGDIDEAVDETFPASDPPSFTATTGEGHADTSATAQRGEEASPAPSGRRAVETGELREAIDSGRTGDKVPARDPATAPLQTDAEAAGTPTPREPLEKQQQELEETEKHTGKAPGVAPTGTPVDPKGKSG